MSHQNIGDMALHSFLFIICVLKMVDWFIIAFFMALNSELPEFSISILRCHPRQKNIVYSAI